MLALAVHRRAAVDQHVVQGTADDGSWGPPELLYN